MSAKVRHDPVAYCNYCAEASDWHDDAEEWTASNNATRKEPR